MAMNSTQQDIRTFIIDNFMFGQAPEVLGDDQSFLETGVIDSTGVLELIAFLEQQYAISVDDHEVIPANLDSVAQLVAFVDRKRAAQGTSVAD
jgi:acyl carrier protein